MLYAVAKKNYFLQLAQTSDRGESKIKNKIFFVFELHVFCVLYCHKMSVKGMIEEISEGMREHIYLVETQLWQDSIWKQFEMTWN